MKKMLFILSLTVLVSKAYAVTSVPQPAALLPSVTISSAPAVSNVAATVTITTAPNSGPYSTGLNTYLSHIHIDALSVGQAAASTTLITCTTTNIPGTPGMNFTAGPSTGTVTSMDIDLSSPIQSSSAANIVISCPANSNIRWNLWATYAYQQM